MAAIAPAIVALQPVVATVSVVVTDDMPVVLAPVEVVVQSTPCLEWTANAPAAGGAAQVALPHWKMLRAFIARCSFANDPATFAMVSATSILEFVLGGGAWSRVLSELRDSGLFARTFDKLRDLADAYCVAEFGC